MKRTQFPQEYITKTMEEFWRNIMAKIIVDTTPTSEGKIDTKEEKGKE